MRYLFSFFAIMILSSAVLAQADENIPEYQIFSIYYGGGSYFITSDQTKDLNTWLESIPEIEFQMISIHGHTDNIGSLEYNQWLSSQRCQSALQQLLNKGISHEQISIEDFGELNPVYDNNSWEGRLKNRRVDIIIKPVIL